jgi:hypothetical protein
MITPADALEVMAVVAACHHRTAPRMDDPEAALVIAKHWSELLDGYDFTVPELVKAVKVRAKVCPEAPEAADIIRNARQARSELMARAAAPVADTDNWDGHYPGDDKAAADMASFPDDWDSGQRRSAYWYAVRMHAMPKTTAGWKALAAQLQSQRDEREVS